MLFFQVLAVLSASQHPHIIHIVADDLGYNDLGIFNKGKTHTPYIDSLIQDGVQLGAYYTYRLCSPSRASLMTGRYPWGVGFYDMSNDANHCIRPETTLLPQVLKDTAGYTTHAIGKWDVGYIKQHCTPTKRGFDTFLGYYSACTSDYWYHGAPGGTVTESKCGGIDFSLSTAATGIGGAPMTGPDSLNGTYDRDAFTNRAIDIINNHDASKPLYLYLAFHNVHDSCTKDRLTSGGLNAPKKSVDLYETTLLDTWKVQAAMTTELDYGVGNVTEALKKAGLWNNSVLLFMSDNGGPLDHSTNAPYRGGKGTWYEGGVRVVSFVNSPLLPSSVHGTEWTGMAHSSDWYVTAVEGIVGAKLPITGPRQVDGFNIWPALTGVNITSPRTSVIHGVNGSQVSPPVNTTVCQVCDTVAARFGDYKIILNVRIAQEVVSWPTPADKSIPFGLSGGTVENGTDHYRATLLPALESTSTDDSFDGTWLFNLKTDPSESNNLAGDTTYKDLIKQMKEKLKKAAETGPAPAFEDLHDKAVKKAICDQENHTGYLEPFDWKHQEL